MQITYTLILEKRKSIALGVKDSGQIFVKAPFWMKKSEVDKFVFDKEDWLKKKLAKIREHKKEVSSLYEQGKILYLGGMLTVEPRHGARARVVKNKLIVNQGESVDKQVYNALKKQARLVIAEIIGELQYKMGVKVKSFRLKDNSTNWGSASGKGNLNFNWRVIMAPLEVLRYLVIHEMAHLRHMDHSDRFWNFVSQFDPEWEAHDRWLKDHGGVLRVV